MPDIISRQDALSLGRKRFYTGKLCKYGHDSERYVTTGSCIACLHPKIPEAEKPTPVETFRLGDGRIVNVITQVEAHQRGWPRFFTGQPCDAGHMAERNVKDGRCLLCSHPPKYGIDAFTGWWPFQPNPPLRVPPKTPLTVWHDLAKRLQEEIPKILEELKVTIPVEYTFESIHGIPHYHIKQIYQGTYVYWPLNKESRTIATNIDDRVRDPLIPWIHDDGVWYGLLQDKTKVPVCKSK